MYKSHTKKKSNRDTYEVITSRGRYAVMLEGLKNTPSGNRRYLASIIILHVFTEQPAKDFFFTPCYQFEGHYLGDVGEARWVVDYYEKELKREEAKA